MITSRAVARTATAVTLAAALLASGCGTVRGGGPIAERRVGQTSAETDIGSSRDLDTDATVSEPAVGNNPEGSSSLATIDDNADNDNTDAPSVLTSAEVAELETDLDDIERLLLDMESAFEND